MADPRRGADPGSVGFTVSVMRNGISRTLFTTALFIAAFVITTCGSSAQQVRVLRGSGCLGKAPAISGPLLIGTYIQFDDWGDCETFGGVCRDEVFLFFGVSLAPPQWVVVHAGLTGDPCLWVIDPIVAVLDVTYPFPPMRLPIPANPALIGVSRCDAVVVQATPVPFDECLLELDPRSRSTFWVRARGFGPALGGGEATAIGPSPRKTPELASASKSGYDWA